MNDIVIAVLLVVVFLVFIEESRQFFVLSIVSMVAGIVGLMLDDYFAIPASSREWVIMVYAMTAILGFVKSIYLARKSYRKGKLLMEEVY